MKRSRAELAAHVMKAARGAGLPLAVGEDLYTMANFVTVAEVDWIAADIASDGAGLAELTLALDQIACGGRADLSSPVAYAMAAARGWRLEDGRKEERPPPPETGPLDIPEALWAALDVFAQRTYVPETAESRARGAGAGAIDND